MLVGIADSIMGGISTYAGGLAVAAEAAGYDVTLIAVDTRLGGKLREQLRGSTIRVMDTGLAPAGRWLEVWRRIVPGEMVRVLKSSLARRLESLGQRFSIAHLNVPALAETVRPFADRIVVAAWFYPHGLGARVSRNWQHTGGNPSASLARRAAILAKSVSLYRGDERGFRASDLVVAPTDALAVQLRAMGINCEVCPPPVWLTPPASDGEALIKPEGSRKTRDVNSELTLVTCSADLSNPRKNVGDLVTALGLVAQSGRRATLHAIGSGAGRLQTAIAALPDGATVKFTGSLPREQVHAIVAQADLFVTSSLYEEWGYAVSEALLCGTPVVAYPVYPFEEMLRDGFGTIARDVSPRSLAAAIVAAASNEGRADLAQAAAARFGAEAIGERLAAIWKV
jgi:glycosyltransferase involved in cell wall biosynthesis